MEKDSIPLNQGIELAKMDTISSGENTYEDVLHISSSKEIDVSGYWIARGVGLAALQKDSGRFVRQ